MLTSMGPWRAALGGGGGAPSLLAQVKAMFGGGEQGVIYDTTNPATMFQERTGASATTLSGANGPIGSLKDLSPNNNWAIAPSDAARPLSRQGSGAPNVYVEADGVDDVLQSNFTISQPITRISCFQLETGSAGKRIFGSPTTDSIALFQASVTNFYSMYAVGPSLSLADSTRGTPITVTEQYNGASSRGAINNGAYVTGAGGTSGATGLRIGADATNTVFAALRDYRQVEINRLLTDAEIAICRTWCGQAGGLVL